MFQSFSADVINTLSPLELEILRYINNHKEDIANMSIHDLAKTTFVSATTIIRLCKKLDLEGYSHLKYFLRDKVASHHEENIYASCTLQDLLAEELSDIERTAKGIDLQAVNEIAALMHQKIHIHFFAKGLTNIVFEYASRHLLSLSRHVTLYHDTHIAYIQAEHLTEKDIVFLASLSGETEQVVRVAQIARARNAKTVTFTVKPTSRLAKLGDYHFHLVNDATTTLDVDTKSRCQLMLILNIIIKAFVQQSTLAMTQKKPPA
ncbi:MAG: MurR/RpiR family transcriptional regulator [Christensenellales bacterium]|jgi:DNA-binding MurR/RpiR family transcriptional regulator